MALIIRLRQQGRTNRQTFRLVVVDSRFPRDGKYLEMLGWYNPLDGDENYSINSERVNHWLTQGAEVSDRAKILIGKSAPDVMKNWKQKREVRRTKRAAQRRALKKK